MTNTDLVDPGGDQQTRRPDELEDWLTDLRINLNDDPPDWLTPEDDIADPAPDLASVPSTEDQPVPDTEPVVGRHRAAD